MDLTETLMDAIKNEVGEEGLEVIISGVAPERVEEVYAIFGENLSKSEVIEVLKKHPNLDSALEDLFDLNEETMKAKSEAVKAERISKRSSMLKKAFKSIEEKKIDEIVRSHDGDLEEAARELLNLLEQQEKATQGALVDHCCATFDALTRVEIKEILSSFSWKLSAAVDTLTSKCQERKFVNMKIAFGDFDDASVRECLVSNAWDCAKTCRQLSKRRKNKKKKANKKKNNNKKQQKSSKRRSYLEAATVAVSESIKDEEQLVEEMLRMSIQPGLSQKNQEEEEPCVQQQDKSVAGPADSDTVDNNTPLTVDIKSTKILYGYRDKIRATVQVLEGEASSYDWLALCRVGSDSYLDWKYIKTSANGDDTVLPELSFAAPGYGRYELRYMRKAGGEFKVVVRSCVVTVGADVDVAVKTLEDCWKVSVHHNAGEPLSSSSWVGMFQGKHLLSYQYLKAGEPLTFAKPDTNAVYQFKCFAYKWQGPNAVSESITLEGEDDLQLLLEGAKIQVNTTIRTADPSKECVWLWVGFCDEERPNYYRRLKYLSTNTHSFTLKKPIHAGKYEARIYLGKDKILIRSEPFEVVEE